MLFNGFIGNEAAKAQLSAYLQADRIPHALLIEGPAGCGKRTLARLFATAVLCEGTGERPCGVCAACRKMQNRSHPDMEEYGGDTPLRVDDMRTLRANAFVLPNEGAFRLFLLAGADTMTPAAQNALLKILEEPPAHVRFLITCENRALLLPTVLSRTVCVTLSGVTVAEGLPLLRSRLPQAEEATLTEALTLYDGCIGRALAAAGGDELKRIEELADTLAAAVCAPEEWTLLAALAPLDQKDKRLTDDVLAALALVFRNALAATQGSTRPLSQTEQTLTRRLSPVRLAALVDTVRELQAMGRRHMNQTLLITLISARLRTAAGWE